MTKADKQELGLILCTEETQMSRPVITLPPLTLAEVNERAKRLSIGKMEAKRQLEKEHLLASIQMWDQHRDPKVLTDILLKLAEKL